MSLAYKPLFLSTLFLGTIMAISANSWLGMWVGLEINLLSIIPLMNNSKNLFSSEASLKYFITQALASMFILLAALILNIKNLEMNPIIMEFPNLMMMSALFTKMGAAPFHYWFPQVMEGLSWNNSLIMLTWQKIAPMIILIYIPTSQLTFLIIIISLMTSALMGLNQTSIRKILTYSSINHIAWMLMASILNQSIWLIYFIIYSMMNLLIIWILQKYNIFQVNQLTLLSSNPKFKMFFMLNFFSLGGIPPFIGFMPKWFVIQTMIMSKLYLLSLIMILMTLLTLFYYMRVTLTYFNFLFSSSVPESINNTQLSKQLIFLTSITIMSLPLSVNLINWI